MMRFDPVPWIVGAAVILLASTPILVAVHDWKPTDRPRSQDAKLGPWECVYGEETRTVLCTHD